jgi:hypothetical protein
VCGAAHLLLGRDIPQVHRATAAAGSQVCHVRAENLTSFHLDDDCPIHMPPLEEQRMFEAAKRQSRSSQPLCVPWRWDARSMDLIDAFDETLQCTA